MRNNKFSMLIAVCILLSILPGCDKIFESDASSWLVQAISSIGANFKKSRRIIATLEPADLKAYREILPPQFDMPEHPLVQIAMIDQTDVGPWPLTPYKEVATSLRCSYQGEEGWYISDLPVSTWVAKYAGRTMGYPKYVADEVTFEQAGNVWKSEVVHNGISKIKVEFTPGEWKEQPAWKKNKWEMGGPVLNLMPPGEGPEVVRVGSSGEASPSTTQEKGMLTITIGPDEPFAALVPAGTIAPGVLVKIEEARSLEPEKK